MGSRVYRSKVSPVLPVLIAFALPGSYAYLLRVRGIQA